MLAMEKKPHYCELASQLISYLCGRIMNSREITAGMVIGLWLYVILSRSHTCILNAFIHRDFFSKFKVQYGVSVVTVLTTGFWQVKNCLRAKSQIVTAAKESHCTAKKTGSKVYSIQWDNT